MGDTSFRTPVAVVDADFKIRHFDRILLLGSCFTDNIGQLLSRDRFKTLINPFGPLYNPASILRAIEIFRSGKGIERNDLIESNGQYHSYLCHSALSSYDADKVLGRINQAISSANDFLNKVDCIIITLGTAYVYRLKSSGEIVGNCHKLPESVFTRERLSVEQTVDCLTKIVDTISSVRPDVKIIFTVSPIRHFRDGANGNQLSKSTLLLAIAELMAKRSRQIAYFPSYEIMIDELRDYRFYASDMIHPSDVAIDYFYRRFLESFLDAEDTKAVESCRKLWRMENHRCLTDNPEAIRRFEQQTAAYFETLKKQFPYLV